MENAQAQEAAPTPETTQVRSESTGSESSSPTQRMAELLAAMDAPNEEVITDESETQEAEQVATEVDAEEEAEQVSTEEEGEVAEEEQSEEVDEKQKRSKNFRGTWDHLDEQERRVVELTTKRGLSLKEAQRAVYGDSQPQREETQAQEAADPIAVLDGDIANAKAEIDRLEKEIDENEWDENFDAKAARRKLREQEGTLYELKAERKIQTRIQEDRQQQSAQQERESFQSRFNNSIDAARKDFPDAFVADSEFGIAVEQEVQYLRTSGSPLLNNPDYPATVIARIARQLGVSKAAASALPQKSQPTPVAAKAPVKPNRSIRPVPSGGLPVASEAQSLEQKMAAARGNPSALLDLLKEHGSPIENLAKATH